MQREILFKGKRADNGKWITDSETYICDGDGIWLSDENLNVVKVITETLGRYVGLTDKNGRKIYEGDIVKTKYYGKLSADGRVNFADYDVFEISYDKGAFCTNNNMRLFSLRTLNNSSWLEVIGNIHDNPELVRRKCR